jgi:DNA-binding MarR family transcriptional regulator
MAPRESPRQQSVARFLEAYSRFTDRLWHAGRALSRRYGISATRMGILRVIELRGPCSLGDIRHLTAGHLSALGRKDDRLVAGGWIERGRDPADRRRLQLHLTAKARRMLRGQPRIGPARVNHELPRMAPGCAERVAAAMELVCERMVGEPLAAGVDEERNSS